jgi:DNA-binding GntR family transcriptional regulator
MSISEGNVLSGRRLNVRTKAEAVYDELRARILDGTLEPGSTLNQEALASALGLSITPLREALRRLEAEALVHLEANRTLTVVGLSAHEVRELYAVRLRLDPWATELAAEHADAEQRNEIDRLARQKTEPTTAGRLAANRQFHRAVYSASGNQVLTELLDRLWDQTDRYRRLALQDELHERNAENEHRDIAAAIRSREGGRAAELMHRHVEATLRLLERHENIR